jgi:threonyl-tRNA synthetase
MDSRDEMIRQAFAKIREDMNSLVEALLALKEEQEALKEAVGRLEPKQMPKQEVFRQEVISQAERHKKGLLKQKIVEQLELGKSVPEAKETLVDHQKYCSKASFYRYIEELKRDGRLAEVNGRAGLVKS